MTRWVRGNGGRLVASAVAVAVFGLGALSGCSQDGSTSDSSASPSPSDSVSASANPDASASASAAPQSLPKGEVQSYATLKDGWAGIRSDVTVKDCPTAAGQVTASGTVVNSATKSRDLSILVSWVAPDSASTLLQLQQTLTDVPAGETRDWSVSGSLQTDAGKCFVGARSGSLAGG